MNPNPDSTPAPAPAAPPSSSAPPTGASSSTTAKPKPKPKPKDQPVANSINDSMRSFPAYDDGSMFVVMQYFAKVEDRLLKSDLVRFRTLVYSLKVDDATLTPEERTARVDRPRAELVDLLLPYGQDLVDALPEFERCAAAMVRGANIFHP